MDDLERRLTDAGRRVDYGLVDLEPDAASVGRRSRRRSAVRGGVMAVVAVAVVAAGVGLFRDGGDGEVDLLGGTERPIATERPAYVVEPNQELEHRQVVVVSGFGLTGVERVSIEQCSFRKNTAGVCIPMLPVDSDDEPPFAVVDDVGDFQVSVELWRWMWEADGTVHGLRTRRWV